MVAVAARGAPSTGDSSRKRLHEPEGQVDGPVAGFAAMDVAVAPVRYVAPKVGTFARHGRVFPQGFASPARAAGAPREDHGGRLVRAARVFSPAELSGIKRASAPAAGPEVAANPEVAFDAEGAARRINLGFRASTGGERAEAMRRYDDVCHELAGAAHRHAEEARRRDAVEAEARLPPPPVLREDNLVPACFTRALVVADAARRAWRAPARPVRGFATSRARSMAWADTAADTLLATMPSEWLGGDEWARAQVGPAGPMVARMLVLSRGGNDGSSLIEVAKLCVFLDAFAAELRRTSHPNFIMWPMSAQLAALIIRGEHLRATAHAVGGRGGGTVGDMTRRRMRHAQSIGAPFLGLDSAIVKAAAPSAKAGGGRRSVAATLPLAVLLWQEHLAAESLKGLARVLDDREIKYMSFGVWLLRFHLRSQVLAGLVSARIQEAERVIFEKDPAGGRGIYGRCWTTKDGEPITLVAKAEGYLGPLSWLPEHYNEIRTLAGGQAFPAWAGGWGSKSNPALATGLARTGDQVDLCSKVEIVNALFLGWRVSPLGLTAAVRKQRAFKGHCLHQWPADAMRVVGDLPTIGFEIDEDLRRGFTQSERRMAGHWLRDAREEGAPAPPRGAGPARPPGAAAARDGMEDVYSRGAGREGERAEQTRVRWRFVRYVRAALRARAPLGWKTLTLADSLESVLMPPTNGGEAGEDIGSGDEGTEAGEDAGDEARPDGHEGV